MKSGAYKKLGLFIIGVLCEFSIVATTPLQTLYLTYILSGTVYFILGTLSQKYKFTQLDTIIVLLPLFLMNIFRVTVNEANIPYFFPFAFSFSIFGYFLGWYFVKKRYSLSFFAFLGTYSLLMYYVGFIITPKLCHQEQILSMPSTQINISDWKLINLDSTELSFSRVRNKIVLLNFTWKNCGQCIQKQPYLEKLQEKYENNTNVHILEVDLGKFDSLKEANVFARSHPNKLLWAYDSKNELANKLLFNGAPHEVLVDKQGNVRNIFTGFNNDIGLVYLDKISEQIDICLKEK